VGGGLGAKSRNLRASENTLGYGEDRIVWEQALDIRVWLGLKEDEKGISQNSGEGEAIGGISKKLHPIPAANPVCKGHRLSVSPHVPTKRELKVVEELAYRAGIPVSPHVPTKRELKAFLEL